MSCREFERALDQVFAPSVGASGPSGTAGSEDLELWRSLERHAAACDACSELLQLARLPQAEAFDVAGPVLATTAGGACRQVEASLNEFVGDLAQSARLPGLANSSELIALHLDHCRACSDLAQELDRLSSDLPRLAVVVPETSLVGEVLRRTLPWSVRRRRWWTATWPVLVRRPRFAIEFAYAATLMLVLVFAMPGSPLQAMPERASSLVRAEPFERLERLPEAAQHEIDARLRTAGAGGKRLALGLAASARAGLGTISDEVASWFVTAEDEPPTQDQETKE